jgi:hypothetical protein
MMAEIGEPPTQMHLGRLLVIAADRDVRQSLAFALGVEGFVVVSRADIPGPDAGRGYDCVVLDHRAAGSETPLKRAFCASTAHLIALAGPSHWLAGVADDVLATPVEGQALVQAARRAVGLADSVLA